MSFVLPKNNACSSKGKCMIQSSLTPWSTTISVMKMTAILHLQKKKHTVNPLIKHTDVKMRIITIKIQSAGGFI